MRRAWGDDRGLGRGARRGGPRVVEGSMQRGQVMMRMSRRSAERRDRASGPVGAEMRLTRFTRAGIGRPPCAGTPRAFWSRPAAPDALPVVVLSSTRASIVIACAPCPGPAVPVVHPSRYDWSASRTTRNAQLYTRLRGPRIGDREPG
jgi:hypothetical protein